MIAEPLLLVIKRAAREGWTELDLPGKKWQLTELPPEIGQLTDLKVLSLIGNRLTTLPAEIGELAALKSLDLSFNHLTALPPEIGQLAALQDLRLMSNALTALPPEIGGLADLNTLDLGGNELTQLPQEMVQLVALENLNLGIGVGIEKIDSLDIGKLALETLLTDGFEDGITGYLAGLVLRMMKPCYNQFTTLPPVVCRLSNLQRLSLCGNSLTTLPSEIGQLTALKSLDLSENRLTDLPPAIGRLTSLEYLDLRKNPDLPLPAELLERTDDPQTIIHAYLDYLGGQSRPLSEGKLVLVGEGSVGKSSLVNRLLYNTFDPNSAKTEGIAIHPWEVATQPSGSIRVNVWDFGGQEIMHATHQFFLTRRTLYLLVLDTRLSEAENRLEYWLQIIRSFGGDSPIILVGNKIDQQPLDVDRRGLRDKYQSIKAIVETSCVTNEGIEMLRVAIAEQASTLPHIFDELPAAWFDVKSQLEDLDTDYISYDQYIHLCQKAGVTKERSQRTLLGFLHDLGIVLHFPDPRLETTNILNPEWVTRGVYQILNSHTLFQNGGVLTWNLLGQILDAPEYPRDRHIFIIDMMCKFELCYLFPDREHTYLVPDLLPKEEQFSGAWEDALAFLIHYDVLPSSVFSRFIVRMHRCIHQHTVWRTGVLLALDGNEALVRADLTDNRILIQVRGPAAGRRDLLTRIREQFDAIHHTIQGLRVEEKIPLPSHPGLPPVDYKWLRDLERAGRTEFTPPGCIDPISVSQTLNGIEPQSARFARDSERGVVTEYRFYGSRIDHIGDISTQVEERSRQMDPITGAIISALSAGVAGGVTDVGKKVIVDAYNALKASIKKKQGEDSDVVEAVEKLEEKPESEGRQTMLAEEVADAKLTKDKILVKQAQELIAVLKESAAGQQALGKYNIQAVDSEIGVIGDDAHIEGGIHFGSNRD